MKKSFRKHPQIKHAPRVGSKAPTALDWVKALVPLLVALLALVEHLAEKLT